MKQTFLSLLIVFCSLFSTKIYAQLDVYEQVHEISRKSMKGYLGGVETNKENNTFDMIYVLPSSARKV